MKISEMNMTQLAVFTAVNQGLGAELTSTEEAKNVIVESRKSLDEIEKQSAKEISQKRAFLNELEKIISKLERGGYA